MCTPVKAFGVLLIGTSIVLCIGCAGSRPAVREPGRHTAQASLPSKENDAGGFWPAVRGYFKHRGLDFLDMFDVGVSAGKWARVEAQYGLGMWGLGRTDCRRLRLGQRSAVLGEESETVAPLPLPASLLLYPVAEELTDSQYTASRLVLTGCCEIEDAVQPDPAAMEIPSGLNRSRLAGWGASWGESFPVGVDAHLLVGARARIRPVQVFDFVAGILGWDLAGDDTPGFWGQFDTFQ